jgi:hypothetical protein
MRRQRLDRGVLAFQLGLREGLVDLAVARAAQQRRAVEILPVELLAAFLAAEYLAVPGAGDKVVPGQPLDLPAAQLAGPHRGFVYTASTIVR